LIEPSVQANFEGKGGHVVLTLSARRSRCGEDHDVYNLSRSWSSYRRDLRDQSLRPADLTH
jgi:hypothetical protein